MFVMDIYGTKQTKTLFSSLDSFSDSVSENHRRPGFTRREPLTLRQLNGFEHTHVWDVSTSSRVRCEQSNTAHAWFNSGNVEGPAHERLWQETGTKSLRLQNDTINRHTQKSCDHFKHYRCLCISSKQTEQVGSGSSLWEPKVPSGKMFGAAFRREG